MFLMTMCRVFVAAGAALRLLKSVAFTLHYIYGIAAMKNKSLTLRRSYPLSNSSSSSCFCSVPTVPYIQVRSISQSKQQKLTDIKI